MAALGTAAPADPTAALETERLLLRPWRDDAADLDAYAAICADPETMRFVGAGRPLTRAESAAQLTRFVEHWRRHGYGLRAAVERESGVVVGFVGTMRAGQPGVRPGDVEIGWRLARGSRGRGYATEGAVAVRDDAFARLRLARLVAFVRPANAASIRVIDKLGMRLEKEALCSHGLPMRIYVAGNPLAAAGAAMPARASSPAGTTPPAARAERPDARER